MLNAGEMREGPDQRRCFSVLCSHGCSAYAQVLRLRGSGLQVNERTPSCRGRRGGRAARGRFWMATWAHREAWFHRCAGLRVRLHLDPPGRVLNAGDCWETAFSETVGKSKPEE